MRFEDLMDGQGRTVVHYAPYGPNAGGGFDCGARADGKTGYTGTPGAVTCDGCKRASPGLWPELADEPLKVEAR